MSIGACVWFPHDKAVNFSDGGVFILHRTRELYTEFRSHQ